MKGRWYKGGTLIYFFESFKRKKNINFQIIKLTFNSIFFKETKEFTFAWISRKKLLFEPSVWRQDDTKGGPLSTFLRISREKEILIFKILNSFLIVYLIKSPKSLLSLENLKKNYFLNSMFEEKMIQRGDHYLLGLRISRELKLLIFKILNSFLIVYFIKSPKSLLSLENLEKNYFLNPLFEEKMIQRGDLFLLFWEFQEK